MREIIPLKKDIIFKTKIGEITNISLDHDYKIDNDLINGSVDISESYKMTQASILEEDFYYSLPFSIAISKKIQRDTINIEIEDFNYNINKDVLSVSIDLELTCEEEIEEEEDEKEDGEIEIYNENDKEEKTQEIIIDNESENDFMDNYFNDIDLNNIKNEEEVEINNDTTTIKDNELSTNITNITNNIINTENKYYTYKVYIVREGDTIETICNKYNVTINDLKEYNDVNDIKIGDKIIIPSLNE